MWQPEPGWQPLPSGTSSSTVGVWRVRDGDGDAVVKRIAAPIAGDPPELSDPHHYAYWRREAEVAMAFQPGPGFGLLPPPPRLVEEDASGITVWTAYVESAPLPGPFVARALGRLAAQALPEADWWSRDLLADRLRRTEEHDGWPTLARTTIADVADALWHRRHGILARYAALPQGPAHGDVTPGNLVTRDGDDVVAVDWRMCGLAPHGADLGYFALAAKEDLSVLLEAWAVGHAEAGGDADPTEVELAARTMATFTVLGQAEWALAAAARGDGALAGKYRHPSVAPYLRSLQNHLSDLEWLLGMR